MTAVTRALRGAEATGWQPERLIAATWRGDLTTADSPAQALAWRLNTITEDRPAPVHLNAPTEADTARYATTAATALNTATDQVTAHPQWPHLAGALAAAERTGRDTTTLLTTAATQTTGARPPWPR
ncbi:hypothetical protein [Kitasatospora purpeofusca]|uniref:hypothetical protein n=1 Tax=Kitasatospora purpeofusca TaxID=67352 RepID=UPI003688A5F3